MNKRERKLVLHLGLCDVVITNMVGGDPKPNAHIIVRVPNLVITPKGKNRVKAMEWAWIDLSSFPDRKPKWLYEIASMFVFFSSRG